MKKTIPKRTILFLVGTVCFSTMGFMVMFSQQRLTDGLSSPFQIGYGNGAVGMRPKSANRLYEYTPQMHLDTCGSVEECLKICEVWDGETMLRDIPQLRMLSALFPPEETLTEPVPVEEVMNALRAYDLLKSPTDSTQKKARVNKLKEGSKRKLSKFGTASDVAEAPVDSTKEKGDLPGKFTTCSSMAASSSLKEINTPDMGTRVAILTLADSENPDRARASLEDKRDYANRWGYDMLTLQNLDPFRHISWSKIPALLSFMHMYDYIWVLDLDTVIMDHTIPIDCLFDDRFELIFSMDNNGLNGGSVIVKPSDWVRGFLIEAWTITNVEHSGGWWEQAAYVHLLKDYRLMNHVKLIHQNYLNDYPISKENSARPSREGSFVLHFAGQGDKKWERLSLLLPLRNLGEA